MHLLASRFRLGLRDDTFLSSKMLSGTALSHLAFPCKASFGDKFFFNWTVLLDVLLQRDKKTSFRGEKTSKTFFIF
jgi:hypothetical protein